TLLKEKHDHRVQEVREKFDHDLLAQAWTLGSLAQFQHDWDRGFLLRDYLCLGVVTAIPNQNGHLFLPLWTSQVPPPEGVRDRLSDRWLIALVSKIKFDEEVLLRNAAGHEHDYFQITSQWGNIWRSQSLENRNLTLPVDPEVFSAAHLVDPKWDDVKLEPDVVVRRLSVKVPVRFGASPRNPMRPSRPPGPPQATTRPVPRGPPAPP